MVRFQFLPVFYINQKINQSSNRSPEYRSNNNSQEQEFNSHFDVDEIDKGELTQMLQDVMITEDQVTSAASQEIEQRIQSEMQKLSRPELRFTEETTLSTTTCSSGSGN